MGEYIEREDAINAVLEQLPVCFEMDAVESALMELPAADVREVVRGRWKRVDPRSTVETFRCSECNYYAQMNATNFCPNCGADMRETCDIDSCPIHFPDEQPKYDPDEFFSAERGDGR